MNNRCIFKVLLPFVGITSLYGSESLANLQNETLRKVEPRLLRQQQFESWTPEKRVDQPRRQQIQVEPRLLRQQQFERRVPERRVDQPIAPQIQRITPGIGSVNRQRFVGVKGLDRIKLVRPNLRFNKIRNFSSLNNLKQNLSNTSLTLGAARVNLQPYVNSKNSLTSLSRSITPSALPGSIASKAEIFRVDNGGLVISEQLSYKRKPFSCVQRYSSTNLTKSSKKLCFSSTSKSSTNKKIGSNDKLKLAVSRFRQSIRTKSNLPIWARNYSDEQLNSLQRKTDSQLKTILLNTAKTKITRTIYIPPVANVTLSNFNKINKIRNTSNNRLSRNNTFAFPLSSSSRDLGEKIYLTGFTFADSYDWFDSYEFDLDYIDSRVEFTPFLSASYGFGVRFPLKINTTYKYSGGSTNNATVDVKIAPFNGNVSDYASTGLKSELYFRGKEIVAEVSGDAGVTYVFPSLGQGTLRPPGLPFNKDFTNYLPASLNNGDFRPPNFGEDLPLYEPIIIPFDVLGRMGDYERGGWGFNATAYPGIELNLTSTDMGIKLTDRLSNNQRRKLSYRQQRVSRNNKIKGTVKVDNGKSKFTLSDPYYDLALRVYPGVQLNAGVFLGGETTSVNEFIKFPSLSVTIPSNGVSFNCHKGTICSRTYNINNFSGNVSNTIDGTSRAEKTQTLILEKIIRIKDDEYGKDQFYNKDNIITERSVIRNARRGGSIKSFKPYPDRQIAKDLAQEFRQRYGNRSYHCAGGEVRSNDWDEVIIDRNGNAKLYVGMRLYERSSCSNSDLDAKFNSRDDGRLSPYFSPYITVSPNSSKTKLAKITNRESGSDDYVQITYKLINRTD